MGVFERMAEHGHEHPDQPRRQPAATQAALAAGTGIGGVVLLGRHGHSLEALGDDRRGVMATRLRTPSALGGFPHHDRSARSADQRTIPDHRALRRYVRSP